jgi:hypothetical protein
LIKQSSLKPINQVLDSGLIVAKSAEKDEPEPVKEDALGSAENDQSAPIKKVQAPMRGKRKRDNDVDGGKVAKRSKVAFSEARETILGPTDGGRDHHGKTKEDDESVEDGVPKKWEREDTSEPVGSLKRAKVTATYTNRPGQQSQA